MAKEFWQRVADLMIGYDYKSKEIAHKAGISQRHMNAIISGQRPDPKISTAAALARVLDVSLDWLATGETRKPEVLAGDEGLLLDLYRQLPDELKALAVQTLLGFVKQVRGSEPD